MEKPAPPQPVIKPRDILAYFGVILLSLLWILGIGFGKRWGLDAPNPTNGHIYAVHYAPRHAPGYDVYLDRAHFITYKIMTVPAEILIIGATIFSLYVIARAIVRRVRKGR